MRVVATAKGYRDGRVWDPGQQFDVEEGATATWFVPVDKAPPPAPVEAPPPEPVTLSELHQAAHPDGREQKTPRRKK